MLAQFIYDIKKWFYGIKVSKFFLIFFSFLDIPNKQKGFLHFLAKNNLLSYTWRATYPFDPPKILFRGLFHKLSSKRPPPDLLKPVKGRVDYLVLDFCLRKLWQTANYRRCMMDGLTIIHNWTFYSRIKHQLFCFHSTTFMTVSWKSLHFTHYEKTTCMFTKL